MEVSWNLGSTTVHGTLVRPPGPGLHPAAVMIAGSGPTDRDWNSPFLPGTNGGARLIAEELAKVGFASLCYDKRASGPHAQENMQTLAGKLSMQSHLDELTGAVRCAAAGRPNVAFLFPENANHVLKHEPKPRSELVAAAMSNSYNASDARLDPEGTAAIQEWLQARA
jgi:hypothetical protein